MLDIEGLQFRAALFHCVRTYFRQQGFLEVDTPIRQPVLLPESNIKPMPSDPWFLQSSPEQCMKRLLAHGCDKIFQICPCFRADERGARHLEEFTMLEWYRVDSDYHDLMEDCRGLIRFVLNSLTKDKRYRQTIDRSCLGTMPLGDKWQYISVVDAFTRWASIPLEKALETDRFDEIISIDIEPYLGIDAPTFFYDYPAGCASLARLKENNSFAERFELYIDGMELANGFTELTDAREQRSRFIEELDQMEKTGGARPQMPENFLKDLELINRAAGIAFGLDRLLMLLMSADTIDQVTSFSIDD